jgi:hypothetical protein
MWDGIVPKKYDRKGSSNFLLNPRWFEFPPISYVFPTPMSIEGPIYYGISKGDLGTIGKNPHFSTMFSIFFHLWF